MNHGAGADERVPDLGEGADAGAVADVHHALEDHVGLDHHVPATDQFAADVDAVGVHQRDAGGHQLAREPAAQDLLRRGQLGLVVDAEDFVLRLGGHGSHGHAVLHREADHVGEVVLLLGVVRLQPGDPFGELAGRAGDEAGIDLAELPLLGRGVLLLDDRDHRAALAAQDAAVARGIGHLGREHRHLALRGLRHQLLQRGRLHQRHVAVEDQRHVAGRDLRQGLLHRVAGALLHGLVEPADGLAEERGLHLPAAVAVDHPDLPGLQRGGGRRGRAGAAAGRRGGAGPWAGPSACACPGRRRG